MTVAANLDSRTLAIMARNTMENAIVKQNLHDVYGAETDYLRAHDYAVKAENLADDDAQVFAAQRIKRRVAESYEAFCLDFQPDSTIWERMGEQSVAHVNRLPEPERRLVTEIIDGCQRMNEIDREIAQIKAKLAS